MLLLFSSYRQLTQAVRLSGDVAISSASFILVSSHLQSLLTLLDLSRRVFNRVKFNFVRAIFPRRASPLIHLMV